MKLDLQKLPLWYKNALFIGVFMLVPYLGFPNEPEPPAPNMVVNAPPPPPGAPIDDYILSITLMALLLGVAYTCRSRCTAQ